MRIVALSDQHGFLPDIPPCDLLIVAGDVCPDRMGRLWADRHPLAQKGWFDNIARPWLAAAPATHKLLTWGNHDWCGQACSFHDAAADATSDDAFHILVDEAIEIPDGRGGRVKIWCSPWSNQFGGWAFMQSPREIERIYDAIPGDIDILVSHQPPYGYGDHVERPWGGIEHAGSRELLATIRRVKPKLVICGHIHPGYGRYECESTAVHNVAVVDDSYRLVREPTIIDLAR